MKTVKLTDAEIKTISLALDSFEGDHQHSDSGWMYSGLSKSEIKRFYQVREKIVGTPAPDIKEVW